MKSPIVHERIAVSGPLVVGGMTAGMTAGRVVWILVGVLIGVGIWKIGMGMLRALSGPPMKPPEPGELRKVNMRYRCEVCGVELRLTLAPDEDPPPPRHCLEDMVEVAPIFE